MEKIFDEFMYSMQEHARRKYSQTEEAVKYREKMQRSEQDLEMMLAQNELQFVREEYIPARQEAAQKQENWVYRQGFLDCIFLLKKFGVIA